MTARQTATATHCGHDDVQPRITLEAATGAPTLCFGCFTAAQDAIARYGFGEVSARQAATALRRIGLLSRREAWRFAWDLRRQGRLESAALRDRELVAPLPATRVPATATTTAQ